MVLDAGVIKEFDTPTNLLNDTTSVFYGMTKDAGLHVPWCMMKMNGVDGFMTAVCHGYIENSCMSVFGILVCLLRPVWYQRIHNV